MTEEAKYLDRSLRIWIAKTARKEHWRLPSWYSLSDLEQDGYLCYAKCWARYKDDIPPSPDRDYTKFDVADPTKTQRRHFMTLVQHAYLNHIMTLASRYGVQRTDEVAASQVDDETGDSVLEQTPAFPDATLAVTLARLPAELTDVLDRVINDGIDTGEYLRKRLVGSRQTVRETTTEYWDRVTGVPNVIERFAEHFKP